MAYCKTKSGKIFNIWSISLIFSLFCTLTVYLLTTSNAIGVVWWSSLTINNHNLLLPNDVTVTCTNQLIPMGDFYFATYEIKNGDFSSEKLYAKKIDNKWFRDGKDCPIRAVRYNKDDGSIDYSVDSDFKKKISKDEMRMMAVQLIEQAKNQITISSDIAESRIKSERAKLATWTE